MRRQINNIISVFFTSIKFIFIKLFHWSGFSFKFPERFSPNVVTEINRGGIVSVGKRVSAHSGCKIKVRDGGLLIIGDGVKLNYNCLVICHSEIRIGKGTEFGPNVSLFDHDHDYRIGLKENKYLKTPISIGQNCWIGANTVILRGTSIGDNCVIGAGCVIKGIYPDNSVVLQKKETVIHKIMP